MLSRIVRLKLRVLAVFLTCQFTNYFHGNHFGFDFDNEKQTVKIHFKSYNNLIIIESVIDEKKINLILDLGANHKILRQDQTNIKSLSLYLAREHRITERVGGLIYGRKSLPRGIRIRSVAFNDTEV